MTTQLQDVRSGMPNLGASNRSSPHCRFCKAAHRTTGCVACQGEADRAYEKAFPNGPQAVEFRYDSPADMEKLQATMGMGNLARGNNLTRDKRIARELENVERERAGLPPIEPNAELAELEAMTQEEVDADIKATAGHSSGSMVQAGRVLLLTMKAGTNERSLPVRVIPRPAPPPVPPVTGPNYLHLCKNCGKFHIVAKPASAWDKVPYPLCCGQAAAFQKEQEAPPPGFHWLASLDADGLPQWTLTPTSATTPAPIGAPSESPDKTTKKPTRSRKKA